MTVYTFQRMTPEYAQSIAKWTYPEPYGMYSMDDDEETILELLCGDYYYALNEDHELIGYICAGNAARVPGGYAAGIYENNQVIDVGLGLRPNLTGRGVGVEFFSSGIQFLINEKKMREFQLVVASFNERAVKVYERVGFMRGCMFQSIVRGEAVDFQVMNVRINLIAE
ncbi:GNAT family N-acetyltransferase [Paenibacillus sp. N1-5-1-14]|uniref:GNAT family N-acetyltransferase n=1 Tax=Paenibacillus radicibacter TaxID=2972488 RepID=UPI002158DD5C|nr:GNAT family protein [Paenibacillus radicibacter]MCR8644421.1 GNAT family N-acetyltransferase [Paenibacillus radicibacter]